MSIAKPSADNSQEIVLPDFLQLLLGGLFLVLLLCIPIVVLTKHAKLAAAMPVPVTYSEAPAAETNAPPDTHGPGALEVPSPIAQSQIESASFSASGSPSVSRASNGTLAGRDGNVLSSQETEKSQRLLHRATAGPAARARSAKRTLSRDWFRTKVPSHIKAALIAIWQRNFKQRQRHRH